MLSCPFCLSTLPLIPQLSGLVAGKRWFSIFFERFEAFFCSSTRTGIKLRSTCKKDAVLMLLTETTAEHKIEQ